MTITRLFLVILTISFAMIAPKVVFAQESDEALEQIRQQQSAVTPNADILNLFEEPETKEYSGYDKPHRTVEELAHWLSGVIMNALDINHENPKEDAKRSQKHFSKPAFREYLEFLSKQSYWMFIVQRKYNMNAASRRLPALLCKASINGLYTWIFEVPVIINLLESPDTPNASGKNAQEIVNLRIRLVRVPNMAETPDNPHQILIENWSLQDDSAILNNNIQGCM